MNTNITQVCVIGSGKLSLQCAALAKSKNLPVTLYDMGQKKSAVIENQAKAAGIPFHFQPPKEVFQMLGQAKEPMLLVSAINERIIPSYVLDNQNIRAVNLHQALLPAHPGRNAEAWAIFEQDRQAGITWHEVSNEVDGGKILIQKEIPLDRQITAFQLFQKQIASAYAAFQEIFDALIEGSLEGKPQRNRGRHKMHYKKDIPGEGILDIRWSGEKISAFLRALDYAGLAVFEKPVLYYGGNVFQWKKYEIQNVKNDGPRQRQEWQALPYLTGKDIIISKDGWRIVLKDYQVVGTADPEAFRSKMAPSKKSPAS